MPIPMGLYYLLLAPGLFVCYGTIFFLIPAYTYGTLLPSTDTIFYWPTAYHFGTLLQVPSTGPLPIPMVFYYFLQDPCVPLLYSTIIYWLPAYPYDTLLSFTGSLSLPMVHYYLLLASCLNLWYSTTFYWPTA